MKKLLLISFFLFIISMSYSQTQIKKHENYTVKEIDELRKACELRYVWGTTKSTVGISRSFKEEDKIKAVEEMIRTYILAGITAEDIYKEDNKK